MIVSLPASTGQTRGSEVGGGLLRQSERSTGEVRIASSDEEGVGESLRISDEAAGREEGQESEEEQEGEEEAETLLERVIESLTVTWCLRIKLDT